jgi:hypothetical protein
MGWRFRRTLSMGSFRWTVSKSGVGGSWGLGGILRFGVSPDGRRYISIRIPGTGVSWVKYYGRPIASPNAGSTALQPSPTAPLPPPHPLPPQSASTQNPAKHVQTNQPWWKQKGP